MTRSQRILSVAATAALLSLGMVAQSSTSQNSQQQNTSTTSAATQPANAADSSTTPGATGQPPLAEPVKQGFWGHLNPFARKKYVQNQMSPIRDRVNELDGLTNDNAKTIADTDARAKAGISAAQGQAQQAADTANQAQQQVQQDGQQAQQLDSQVSSVNSKVQSIDQYQVAQTAELHFQPGPAKLSNDAQQQLNSFLNGLGTQKGYVVEVTAFSTRKGAAGVSASQDLADAVVRYMVLQQNIPLYRIYTMGMGNAAPTQVAQASEPSTPSGTRATQGGTVEIKILKNSLADSTSGSGMIQ